jgi:hypothetical protein
MARRLMARRLMARHLLEVLLPEQHAQSKTRLAK